jgi:hypothetical protein
MITPVAVPGTPPWGVNDVIVDGHDIIDLLQSLPQHILMLLSANRLPTQPLEYRPFIMEMAGGPVAVINVLRPLSATIHVYSASGRLRLSLLSSNGDPETIGENRGIPLSPDRIQQLVDQISAALLEPMAVDHDATHVRPLQQVRNQIAEEQRRAFEQMMQQARRTPGNIGTPEQRIRDAVQQIEVAPERVEAEAEIRRQEEEFGRPARIIDLG